MLHPELLAFQTRLEAAGVVVARHADHLCIRLPLLCSVRVRFDGERFGFEPRIGAVSRTTATMGTLGVATAAVAGLAATAATLPVVVVAGAAGALAIGYDVLRYVVIEGAMTRATLLWELRRGSGAAGAHVAAPQTRGALNAAAPNLAATSAPRERAPAARDGER